MKNIANIVIDIDENDIKSITADRAVNVVIVNSSESLLQSAIELTGEDEELSVIPGELPSSDPTSARIFEVFEAEVDEEGVSEVYTFVNDPNKVSAYSRAVLDLYKKDLEAEEENEEDPD